MRYDLISIGSGSAGRRVAVAFFRAGWKVAIVEKDVDSHFGGTCICSGCIPTKALVEKSHKTKDFKQIVAHKQKIVERIRSGTLRHVEERTNMPVIRGEAKFVDEHTIDVNGQQYEAERFVIATGSKSMIPPIPGLKDVNYMTSKEILELTEVPKSLLVIGGGRIGLEFAQLYHSLGTEVTVFEGMPQILPGEDTEMAHILTDYLRKLGIRIILNKFVDEVREDDGFTIILKDGENKGEYTADKLLVATGRIPNSDELNLDAIGVMRNKSAIVVNDFMQTNLPHIFAIGDVVGNPMFTNWASYQSGVLLNNLKADKKDPTKWNRLKMPNVPRICFTTPEFAATGLTEEQARAEYGDDVVIHKFYNKWLGKSMIVEDWDGVLKAVGRKGSNEILGVHLWGERTGSLIQMIVMAMENDLGWTHLADMVYGHPVLAEGVYSLASGMKGKTL
ncbi:MAG: NAD(P)/FAD-dependent oxidoreductase [Candidatus Heimdallarchaeota archaeon]|nr:NAD(P)/FAD-dependent oxidoreductase [Candidatus Heimdallarchaeota archaeon]